MRTDDKVRAGKLRYDINREAEKNIRVIIK